MAARPPPGDPPAQSPQKRREVEADSASPRKKTGFLPLQGGRWAWDDGPQDVAGKKAAVDFALKHCCRLGGAGAEFDPAPAPAGWRWSGYGQTAAALIRQDAAGQHVTLLVSAVRCKVVLSATSQPGRDFIRANFGPALDEGPRRVIISRLTRAEGDFQEGGIVYQAAGAKRLSGVLCFSYYRGFLAFAGEPAFHHAHAFRSDCWGRPRRFLPGGNSPLSFLRRLEENAAVRKLDNLRLNSCYFSAVEENEQFAMTGTPDKLICPAGAAGAWDEVALKHKVAVVLDASRGDATADSMAVVVQVLTYGILLELAREAERSRRAQLGLAPALGLAAPLLVASLPQGWEDWNVDSEEGYAGSEHYGSRVYAFSMRPDGLVDIWRSRLLDMHEAADHLYLHVAP